MKKCITKKAAIDNLRQSETGGPAVVGTFICLDSAIWLGCAALG